MCAVSFIGDDWRRRRGRDYEPWIWPHPSIPNEPVFPPDFYPPQKEITLPNNKKVTREEFNALKKEIEELKEELEKARQQDVDNGEPDCEMDDKVRLIKELAKLVGIDMQGIFPNDNRS